MTLVDQIGHLRQLATRMRLMHRWIEPDREDRLAACLFWSCVALALVVLALLAWWPWS
jgi:hypothetical protein